MPFADLVVVGVVRGSNFNQSCTKLHIDMLVGYDLDLATDYRQYYFFTDQIFIALVCGIDHYRCIAEVGLWPCRCYNDIRQILALICFVGADFSSVTHDQCAPVVKIHSASPLFAIIRLVFLV